MTAELQAAAICLAGLFIGYVGIFANLKPPRMGRLLLLDGAVFVVCAVTVGALYGASGVQFSIGFGQVNWFWFTLIAYAVLEIPFFLWLLPRIDWD